MSQNGCCISTQMTIAMVLFLLFSNLKGSDANGHVQKALNAFNVYDNIVKNIDDANITALTALNISSSTNDVSILWYYYFWTINIHFFLVFARESKVLQRGEWNYWICTKMVKRRINFFQKHKCLNDSTLLNGNVSLCKVVNVVTSNVFWYFSQAVDVLNSQLNLTRSQSNDIFTEASSLSFKQRGKADKVLFSYFFYLDKTCSTFP